MNKILMLNPFNNVVASGVAHVDLNPLLGNTLECINLTLGGTAFTKAMITSIQLKANSKVIWESDGSKLDAGELYKGGTSEVTKLSINFMEIAARSINSFNAGALYLGNGAGISNLRLEVTIAGATAPTLSGVAELSPGIVGAGEENIVLLMKRRHRNTQTIGAGGAYIALQVPHIDPSGGGSVYQRIFVFSANMTAMRAMREGVTEFEVTKSENETIQKKAKKVPQANLFVFDPILDGVQAGRVWDTTSRVTKSAQFYGLFSAGETITIETEELIPLGMY